MRKPTHNAEDEHAVIGQHDKDDFLYMLAISIPEDLLKGVADNLIKSVRWEVLLH